MSQCEVLHSEWPLGNTSFTLVSLGCVLLTRKLVFAYCIHLAWQNTAMECSSCAFPERVPFCIESGAG